MRRRSKRQTAGRPVKDNRPLSEKDTLVKKHTLKTPRTATTARRADGADTADSKSPHSQKAAGWGEPEPQRESHSTRLIGLAHEEGCEFFHTPDEEAYATVRHDGRQENYAVRGRTFRDWLARLFYEREAEAISSKAIKEAVSVLEAEALYEGPEHPVFIRVAERNGAIYLDLANPAREAAKITAEGWRILSNPAVRFVRPKGMLPLPRPKRGGSVDELLDFVNIKRRDDQVMLVGSLLSALQPRGPYPPTEFQGGKDSGKSTTMRVCRSLINPNTAPIRGEPHEVRDLMIAARNGWYIAFDNLSYLPRWLSDALCRLSTGGGFATRRLYTDLEEVLIDAQRPVMLTGIEDLAIRDDLRDRTVTLELPPIPDERRRTEKELWQEFEKARPRILGALLDAVSYALGNLSKVNLPSIARMADFEVWVTAAEPALGWPKGTFREAYARNRRIAKRRAAEREPVSSLIMALVREEGEWKGTVSDLLRKLEARAGRRIRLPVTPAALGTRLRRRLKPDLWAAGVEVIFDREGHRGERTVLITRREEGRQHRQRKEGAHKVSLDSSDAV